MMVLKGVESTWKKIMEKTTRIEKESGFGVKTLGGRSRKQVCFVWLYLLLVFIFRIKN